MLRWFTGVLLSVLVGLGALPAKAQDIVIGFGGIFSGPYSTYSEDARRGMDIVVADINAQGGVLGRKVRMEYYDTGADRAKAVAIYRKWAGQPDVAAYLTISAIEFIALDPVADEVKLPIIPFGSTTPFPKFSSWAFRNNTVMTKTVPYVLDEIRKLRGIKSFSIIQDTANPAMTAEANAFKDAAPALGVELKSVKSFATNDQDFSSQLTNIKAADPDMLDLAGVTYEASLIITQARALKLRSIIVGGNGLNDPRVSNLPGGASEGIITFFSFDPNDERPIVKNFAVQYQKLHKSPPPAYASLGADAIYLVADAIKRAGGTDREKVRESLGKTKDLEVLNGTLSFNGPGDNLNQKVNIYENRGGKFIRIR